MTALRLPRPALIDAIRSDPAPYVVICAPAGTGKSWLMQDLRAAGEDRPIHDLAPGGPHPLPPAPAILAFRPGTAVDGLARAEVYGRVSRHDDLWFSEAEMADHPGLHARTGGWACLIPAAHGTAALEEFLRTEILSPLPSVVLVALDVWLDRPAGPPPPGLAGLGILAGATDRLPPHLAAVRLPLGAALGALLSDRALQRDEARVIAGARARLGQVPQAMALYQSIGALAAAQSLLRDEGGLFYIHRHGPAAFDRMLAGFPPPLLAEAPALVLCRAIQAIKRGEVQLMRRILTDRWGAIMDDAPAVMAARDRFTLEERFARLLIRTWEDYDLDGSYLDQAWALLADIPTEDDLRRGSFYNAVLEFYIRGRRFAEAELVAQRAADHYARAGVPILSFYIDLHRAIVRLVLGHLRDAARHARTARAHLQATPYDSPGDARLLALTEACIAYEGGAAEPLTRFLADESDALAQGEIWPTIVELVLIYGTQALAEARSFMAARSFLDRWRVTEARASQFRRLIDLREVTVTQSAGRWAEAAAQATALSGRTGAAAILAAGPALSRLSDRDEIATALLWLRQTAQTGPATAGLDAALAAILDNPHLTARQRRGAEVWLAHVLQRSRRGAEAQAQLRRTLTAAAEEGAVAALTEERSFLSPLLANSRLRAGLDRAEPLRRLLRQLAETGPGRSAAAAAAGLTRQEARILNAICEGATAKAVGNLLGLSESTVKFHLANLYRKLGVSRRAEAIAAAGALRLVP